MTDAAEKELLEIYDHLFRAYGPQHWWPAESTLEVAVGAILTQNTAWRNVERAIAGLRAAGALDWQVLREAPIDALESWIRPAGTFRVKARRLKAFVAVLWTDHNGSLDAMLAGALPEVRARLLAIPGIGPETADAILLYAGERPSFVVDAYTQRVLRRHGLIDRGTGYEATRGLFERSLPVEVPLYQEYHALLVAVGKAHCGPTARCAGCPLEHLPHDGLQ